MILPTFWAMGEAPITATERGAKNALNCSRDDDMIPFDWHVAFKLGRECPHYFLMRMRLMMHSRPAVMERGFSHFGQLKVGKEM